MRRISQETLNKFGVYQNEQGNIVFPLVDDFHTMSYVNNPSMPKYLLPSGFKKSEFLYGFRELPEVIDQPLYITEGYFDVMSLVEHDIPAVGLLGTTLSNTQIDMIRALGVKEIILALDRDRAGLQATLELGYKLAEHGFDVKDFYNQDVVNQYLHEATFKDMNELHNLYPDLFLNVVTHKYPLPYVTFVSDFLYDDFVQKHHTVTARNATELVEQFLEYGMHARVDDTKFMEGLGTIQERLKLSDTFIGLTIENYQKQLVSQEEEKKMDGITIKKGKILENGDGLFSINLGGISLHNIYVTDTDKGIFVNMPKNKGKDGKYYDYIRLGSYFKDQMNLSLFKSYLELKQGMVFEEKTLPLTLQDEFSIKENSEFKHGQTTFFTLQNPDFLINNMRFVETDTHRFVTFEQHLGNDGEYHSHFFAEKEFLTNLREKLFPEQEKEMQQEQATEELEME